MFFKVGVAYNAARLFALFHALFDFGGKYLRQQKTPVSQGLSFIKIARSPWNDVPRLPS
jgi:hypothetical protein